MNTRRYFSAIALIASFLLFSTLPLHSEDWRYYKADNYHDLETNSDGVIELQNLLLKDRVFLYVSGCHLDGEAMPAFIRMSKKYPKATFVHISQHGSTKDFMRIRYGSFGAPKIYAFGNGTLVSQLVYAYDFSGGKSKFLGWDISVTRWIDTFYPILDRMASLENVIGLSSFSPHNETLKKMLLFRTNPRAPQFRQDIKTYLQLAESYPDKTFAIDSGSVNYNQMVTYRYRYAFNAVSIIENHRILAINRRGRGYDLDQMKSWLEENWGTSEPVSRPGAVAQTSANITVLIAQSRSDLLAITPANVIQAYDKANRTIQNQQYLQLFYNFMNAIIDPQRNNESAKAMIQALYLKNAGGIAAVVPSAVLRRKVYASTVERYAIQEKNSDIKRELLKLAAYYYK